MHTSHTDFLPPERRHWLARDYFWRLGIVVILAATVLVIIAAALLVPTYLYLKNAIRDESARSAALTASLASPENAHIATQLTALSDDAAVLEAHNSAPSVIAGVQEVLAVAHPGITLSSIQYAPTADTDVRTIVLSGKATTRETLRNYQLALQSAPIARAVDLPVSAYAKSSDITFTITITLAL